MQHSRVRLADLRRDAAPMLLVLFVLTVQLGPAAHLAFHTNDHSHGVELAPHALAHRSGHPHVHEEDGAGPGEQPVPGSSDGTPDHGQWTSSHFGLALLDSATPPDLPPPAERLAPHPASDPRPPRPPDRQMPPARGPPVPDSTS